MSLDTQTFGLSRYWLFVALEQLPSHSAIFTPKLLCDARKAFLAGTNQIAAIKNWLVCAGIVDVQRGQASLTELGKLIAARDPRAEQALTWWLVHLHLCANPEAYPYTTFFCDFDPESKSWWSFDDLVHEIHGKQSGSEVIAEKSVRTYFDGIEQTLRPTWPIYGLGLVERRKVKGETGKERIRRRRVAADDVVVLYGVLLFQHRFFPGHSTVEARQLLERGLGRSLGMRDSEIREALIRIHQDPQLSEFLHYTQAANLDSVQFGRSGAPALKQVRMHAYQTDNVRWP